MPRRKLPIGIQTFAKMREEDYYYVDKTGFIARLIDEGSFYFLSRPRRFGKSLLIDTIGELFAGNEPLFRGLAIHPDWDWSVRYPVIRLSFGGGVVRSRARLDTKIGEQLRLNMAELNVECTEPEPEACLAELIGLARQMSGQRAVVLVDEYDKPILDNLTRPELARELRDGLRNLYSVIKDREADVRFVLITGVSKFSRVSLFSGLNNLNDITVDAPYSALCGYTETDLDTVFAPELHDLDRAEIRQWYNGYNWLGDAVYNPFDLLLLFQKRELRSFWFETGSPTGLIDLLMQRGIFTPDLSQTIADDELLSSFDVDHIATEALLWQTGYLTFAEVQRIGARARYRLTYPNLEVQSALNDVLAKALMGNASQASRLSGQIYDILQAGDPEPLREHLHSLFAAIPHHWYDNTPIAHYEGYWASVFYSHLASLGLELIAEDITHHGRIDLTLKFNHQIWLFEFKVAERSPAGSALQQIKDKGYADKYRALGQPIFLIGIAFSEQQRQLVGFDVERID
ncbi:MAG: ATP-binding protein [Lamprobacter sp.]|uniref:ATP-binding protein n=1 Tax=Lamprobacter sp. TaxID=3100796 RepID=UPI002B25AD1F|nr:ATP-binding protein [Lamprobacter sp.]MEA3643062.1 ATP-binding protein [Lamprobacter sp.]